MGIGTPLVDRYGVMARRFGSTGAAVGAELRVDVGFTVATPDVAIGVGADGGFVVSWVSYDAGDTYAVAARRFDSAGTPQFAELMVNEYQTDDQREPRLAIDGDGDFVVAYSSERGAGLNQEVLARRLAADTGQGELLVKPPRPPATATRASAWRRTETS